MSYNMKNKKRSAISSKEISMAVNILKKIDPGFLPLELFIEFARLYVTPIIEIVPIRIDRRGEIRIILLKRDKSDPIWPGQLHTPGTVLRTSDKNGNLNDAFLRILKNELKLNKNIDPSKLIFVDYIYHEVLRGKELALVFLFEYSNKPARCKEYNAEKLPANLVTTQIDFIKKVIDFVKIKNHL